MNEKNKKYLTLALFFLLGVAVAVLAGRFLSTPPPAQPVAVPSDPAAVARFLEAAERSDYALMAKTGEAAFPKGSVFPDAEKLFKDYASNSFPPYTVYAFYSEGSNERVRRVLLTLDGDKRVESFLAEEMNVVQ